MYGTETRNPPEQLPIVLQVLLSKVHRLRALELLGRFTDLGPWAVSLVSMACISRNPPEQLPILQVLLSQVHRLRALELLGRFLDLGPWAVSVVSIKVIGL